MFADTTWLKKRGLSASISLVFIAALVSIMMLLQGAEILKEDTTVIRRVELAVLPPPPPPVPTQQAPKTAAPTINVNVNGEGVVMEFGDTQLAGVMNMDTLKPPPLSLNKNITWQSSLSINWEDAFGLSELDENPRLLTHMSIQYPSSLSRRGINKVTALVDVMIDGAGRVVLRKILRNPYPEMTPVITKLVNNARFTAPKKDGVIVRAAFNWPLEFSKS
ncbi:MAG: hypothetical protein JKY66_01465 [Spongiibacteraceae bacterium]|nr:hypothetical protein [Spongiibacteraceae bacterium]